MRVGRKEVTDYIWTLLIEAPIFVVTYFIYQDIFITQIYLFVGIVACEMILLELLWYVGVKPRIKRRIEQKRKEKAENPKIQISY